MLDLSRVLAGPYATMLLADLGAEVIKVEHPVRGDDTRYWTPPEAAGESAYFLAVNRGKRSIGLDLASPPGRDLALRLCAGADVVVENFRPGGAARLGLDHEQVRAAVPSLVYCSISAYPAGHPQAADAGFDAAIQAQSGLMAITGDQDGPPAKVGVALVDVLAGLNASTAILAALRRREQTGQGEHVTVSLLGSALSGLVNVAQNALITDTEPTRHGNAHPSIVPYQAFPTRDGAVMVAAGNDQLYRRLCAVLNRPDLAEDARFDTNSDRVRHRQALIDQLTEEFRTRDTSGWTAALRAGGIPASPVNGVLAALRDAGPSAIETLRHPVVGPLETVRPAFTLAGSGSLAVAPPPLLGEHTDEVLAEIGVDAAQRAALRARSIITPSSDHVASTPVSTDDAGPPHENLHADN
ncbi:putative acyl-CoA transferase/carnitine dehydratase [Actinoalloteichus sp. GBA129-24]|uniref:Acyl-CoA transferase/carnitine dehydratase n=1 Tax=Actinoalloteichus fjordicus TaxID=1612552 RepID=A0AAC9LJ87_9PSEU|nr:putative acyl-CoA transferase/carnitine dehydratase [Actinoalloteichus fjordicus]APU23847.1 putative acyl-CoA transferase/carnitine dehydratase [Actinoalloteichus sp. GBA129-24]